MLTPYLVFATIFSVIWLIGVILCLMDFLDSYSSERPRRARRLLIAIALLPAAWLWPLTVPCLVVYALVLLVREADLDLSFNLKRK